MFDPSRFLRYHLPLQRLHVSLFVSPGGKGRMRGLRGRGGMRGGRRGRGGSRGRGGRGGKMGDEDGDGYRDEMEVRQKIQKGSRSVLAPIKGQEGGSCSVAAPFVE